MVSLIIREEVRPCLSVMVMVTVLVIRIILIHIIVMDMVIRIIEEAI